MAAFFVLLLLCLIGLIFNKILAVRIIRRLDQLELILIFLLLACSSILLALILARLIFGGAFLHHLILIFIFLNFSFIILRPFSNFMRPFFALFVLLFLFLILGFFFLDGRIGSSSRVQYCVYGQDSRGCHEIDCFCR